MGIRQEADYIKGVKSRQNRRYGFVAKRITDVYTHPVFTQPIKELARLS